MLFEGYTTGAGRESRRRLLDTGDLRLVDADGLLFVDGRADDMIVSGGENVFPRRGGGPDRPRSPASARSRWSAYPTESTASGSPRSWPAPRRELTRRRPRDVPAYLARFSVPRDVDFVKYLPRNATGKVLGRELRRYFG